MRNFIFILLSFLLLSLNGFSQTHFGEKGVVCFQQVIDLTKSFPSVDTTYLNYLNYYSTGHSSICDSQGNLQFSCNGCFILDKKGVIMENGDTVSGKEYAKFEYGFSSYSQNNLILPFPDHKYKVIIADADDTEVLSQWYASPLVRTCFNEITYSEVDMSLNAGLGKVTQKHVPFFHKDSLGRTGMMACRHANGKDWWLLSRAWIENRIYKHLVTEDSIYYMGSQSYSKPTWALDNSGQMMFSPDGSKVALTVRMSDSIFFTTQNRNTNGNIFLADFNRCTGMLSNEKAIPVPSQLTDLPLAIDSADVMTQGLCFSPNGQFIYVSKYANILQYDLWDTDSSTAWYHVMGRDTTNPPFMLYASLFPAPNGKIYIGNWGGFSSQMSVIDNPNVKGVGCYVCKRCMVFPSYVFCMPDMPNYDLGVDSSLCWPLAIAPSPSGEGRGEVLVYPNPTSGKFQIRNSKPQSVKELYNSVGQLILSTKENEIDVSHLSKGIYYLRCENQSVKVVVE